MKTWQAMLVKDSFRAASPQREALAGSFLAELRARDPLLWNILRRDRALGGARLHEGLAAIIASVDRLHPIVPVLEWLAFQGDRRGIGERHHAAIVEALVAALASVLGEAFTPRHREAWELACGEISLILANALAALPLAA